MTGDARWMLLVALGVAALLAPPPLPWPVRPAAALAAPTPGPAPAGETSGPATAPKPALAGIGARLEKDGDAFLITLVAPGGGAAEARLVPNDRIVAIDGRPVAPMAFAEAYPLLQGPEGTTVTLQVVKWSAPKGAPIAVVVRRRDARR